MLYFLDDNADSSLVIESFQSYFTNQNHLHNNNVYQIKFHYVFCGDFKVLLFSDTFLERMQLHRQSTK